MYHRDVCIRDVSVLERYLFERGACISGLCL